MKNSNAPSSPTLPITRVTLAELNVIAIGCPLDFSHTTYLETQQILTLWSLSQYFADRGLEIPFHIDVKELKHESANSRSR